MFSDLFWMILIGILGFMFLGFFILFAKTRRFFVPTFASYILINVCLFGMIIQAINA